MDKDLGHILLRHSLQKNSRAALEIIKLLHCQAKAIINHEELREDKDLFYFSEKIITTLLPSKSLLERMSEEL